MKKTSWYWNQHASQGVTHVSCPVTCLNLDQVRKLGHSVDAITCILNANLIYWNKRETISNTKFWLCNITRLIIFDHVKMKKPKIHEGKLLKTKNQFNIFRNTFLAPSFVWSGYLQILEYNTIWFINTENYAYTYFEIYAFVSNKL